MARDGGEAVAAASEQRPDAIVLEALELGARDYLVKPFIPDERSPGSTG